MLSCFLLYSKKFSLPQGYKDILLCLLLEALWF